MNDAHEWNMNVCRWFPDQGLNEKIKREGNFLGYNIYFLWYKTIVYEKQLFCKSDTNQVPHRFITLSFTICIPYTNITLYVGFRVVT